MSLIRHHWIQKVQKSKFGITSVETGSKKNIVGQKVPHIMIMGYPKCQSITFETSGDTGGLP